MGVAAASVLLVVLVSSAIRSKRGMTLGRKYAPPVDGIYAPGSYQDVIMAASRTLTPHDVVGSPAETYEQLALVVPSTAEDVAV